MTKEAIIHDLREIGKTNSVSSYKRMVCEMAADTIENQAKALDALTLANAALKEKVEKFRWIPVEEKMPEPMEWVLCWCFGGLARVLRYDNVADDWDFTVLNGHGYAFTRDTVTHWKPLPEGPEEAKGDD